MINGKSVLAIIPARGGSKGLPRKNILPFLGKPLISWTIEQAKQSKYLDKLIVSTDDAEIKKKSLLAGADVPFMRPKQLASDEAKAIDVILHAINWFENNDKRHYDIVIYLQPTSPLRLSEDIDNAIDIYIFKNAKAIVSLCKTEHSPLWTNILPSNGCMKDFLTPEVQNGNRQDLPTYYRVNGSIYIAATDFLTSHRTFYGEKTHAYIMPQERSIDIDTINDFQLAEFLYKNNKRNNA